MADEDYGVPQPRGCWPEFTENKTVVGMRLLDLVDWVAKSSRVLNRGDNLSGMPVVAMPPVQRTAVWKPKQVLDFWDSLMRGLPIGIFYLVEQSAERDVLAFNIGAGEHGPNMGRTSRPGFDLLDGQQRVRALLVGTQGPAEEKRCLWVDLGATTAGQTPCLRLTSKAQPFGYDAQTGNKLGVAERRKARRDIEPKPKEHPIMCDDGSGRRKAYDLDLFDGPVKQDGDSIVQPPRPHGAKEEVFKLHELLCAWRKRTPDDPEGGIKSLRTVATNMPEDSAALRVLDAAFRRVERGQVALLRISPGDFKNGELDLLPLFERIGAGGTALSTEERLFSIYKYHEPRIHNVVDAIYDKAGRVLSPTKIAATALRIANANAHDRQNSVPGIDYFAQEMATGPQSEFRQKLDNLLPLPANGAQVPDGLLSRSFAGIKQQLSYAENAGDFWMPDVMLAALPAELWQVLVFWATRNPDAASVALCRQDLVRFALFWRFFVFDDEKAARWAFAHIKDIGGAASFPGAALYRILNGTEGGDRCAYALIDPGEFTRRLCKESRSDWRTDKERFGDDKERNEVGAHWWGNGRKVLPWLQRDYVRRVLPGYAPLADQEDDVPYDFDHICPVNDWGSHWGREDMYLRVEPDMRPRMRAGRNAVGNGIGNLRLIESSTNKHDQDDNVTVKMPFVDAAEPDAEGRTMAADSAFPLEQEHRALWQRVSRHGLEPVKNRCWDKDRLAAFQEAVEKRAAWLYRQFYNDLGFDAWLAASHDIGAAGQGGQG